MKDKGFFIKHLKDGLIYKNPILVQFIGICPTLATTTNAKNALAMGMAVLAVLVFSNLFISLLRRFIPSPVRIAAYIVIISTFVTIVEMVMHAYFISLYASLGVFIPLIVVNCLILARAEAFASKNPVIPSIWDGVCMGLGFAVALVILGSVREVLGSGSLFGFEFIPSRLHISMMVLPAGAFIALGFLVAGMKYLTEKYSARGKGEDKNV